MERERAVSGTKCLRPNTMIYYINSFTEAGRQTPYFAKIIFY